MKLLRRVGDLLFVIPFSALLVTINVVRIFKIPITIDETGYNADEAYSDLFFKKYASANNHILHSVLRKFFIDLFGDGLFFYRVDSLIAQIAFLVYSCLISKLLFKNRYWALCGFVILNLGSPFIFDFWGLSRGYGLALSFMAISIYYLLRYMESQRLWLLAGSVLAGCLSVYSNFGMLNYYVALICVVLLQRMLFRAPEYRHAALGKELLIISGLSGLLALLITGPLILLHKGGELSFLGSSGFKNDTVTSIVRCSIFKLGESYEASQIIRIVYFGTFFIMAWWLYILVLPAKLKRYPHEARTGITLHLLLIIPAISLVAQYHLFKINYIIDRAAIFFIILYLLQLIYWLYYLSLTVFKKSLIVLAGILLLVSYNFFSNLHMRTTLLWWFDGDDLVILKRMHDQWKGKPYPIKANVEWEFTGPFKYDVAHFFKGEFELTEKPRTSVLNDTGFDYIYLRQDDIAKVPNAYVRDTGVCGGSFILFRKSL